MPIVFVIRAAAVAGFYLREDRFDQYAMLALVKECTYDLSKFSVWYSTPCGRTRR
ncbi:MAG: hypothetical protein JWO91_3247 [Acidobacteriaceae bacterium]|nr:hypothetical protein [Acidobacteriaceae bacterium]